MSLRLCYRVPDGTVVRLDCTKLPEQLVVGRDAESARIVLNDSQISRAHCALRVLGDRIEIEDLKSRNGTWVNRARIDKAVLRGRDMVRIGGSDLWVEQGDSASEEILVGRSIGGYNLMEILGAGSYGVVYRGEQIALSRPVALKVLDPRHKKDPARVKSFLDEARRAGRLNHPNVVQVHDVCQVEGQYFLVMELIEGGSLGERLRQGGPIGQDEAAQVLIDIGTALSYAESQRLVHRDVKPDNILVNEEGVYKLADLGIAAPIDASGQAQQQRAFGSAHYVAPEQARGGAIDGRADIYALGATLFHLLSGKPLFEGTPREIVSAHLNREPPDLATLVPGLHKDLLALVKHMLAKDPTLRPLSGAEVADRGRVIQESLAKTNGTPVRRRRRTKIRRRSRTRRRR